MNVYIMKMSQLHYILANMCSVVVFFSSECDPQYEVIGQVCFDVKTYCNH